ncbi:sporulation protein YtxC [Alicyclobacillus dauci]|uniref:Sporulation protein YtxC n=1 Tax=Alicyclobacillus dauci TaxID=1475485 RepID=A0ABY6Z838_9BACL|nr:sporulation protein YtxC [Alicyclobacillus dauci]WAH38336.1 putative sporulation protein YtxC [Alicyclobacillus dauci]
MPIIKVTINHAFPALIDKLSRVSGVEVKDEDSLANALICEYHPHAIPQMSQVLTNVLFSDWLFATLEAQLQTEQRQLTNDELEYLILVFLHEVRSGEVTIAKRAYSEWINRSVQGLHALLNANQTIISLDGFARFRLRAFMNGLSSMMADRVGQFMIDREYEESVSMLKYMLESQPSVERELHVFCAPDRVWITDASGGLVRDSDITEIALAESGGDLNSEDLAMSILITRSPCRIVLHDMNPDAMWPSFAETLDRVFSERVQRCDHCSTCQQLEQAHHHLPVDGPHEHRFRRNH